MTPEPDYFRGPQHIAELTLPRRPLEFFQSLLEKVEKTGESFDLVTRAKEFPLGKIHTFLGDTETTEPELPKFSNNKIETDLIIFLTKLTGEENCVAKFQGRISEKPDQYISDDYFDTKIWRWNTIQNNVILGFRTYTDDTGVLSQAWFIEGPKKKWLNFLAKIFS